MKITMDWPAPDHTHFADNAFAANIGKEVTLNLPDLDIKVYATLVAAPCTKDVARFTFDIQEPEACAVIAAAHATGGIQNLTIEDD